MKNSTRRSHFFLIVTIVLFTLAVIMSWSVSVASKAADDSATLTYKNVCQSDIVRQLVGHGRNNGTAGYVTDVEWSPDGQTFLTLGFGKFGRQLFLWGSERTVFTQWFASLEGLIHLIKWSPNSHYFLMANERGQVYLFNITQSSPMRWLLSDNPEPYHVAWSPDSKQFIAAASKDMTLLDLRQLEPVQHFKAPDTLFDVEWSGDDIHFITAGRDNDIYLWDTRQVAPVRQYKGQVGDATQLEWNTDGKHFLTGNNRGEAFLWDIDKETPIRKFESPDRYSTLKDMKWSPDGRQFLTMNDKGNIFLWNMQELQPVREYLGHEPNGRLQSIEWIPDGKQFITAGSDVLLWNVAVSQPIWEFLPATGDALSISLNPDGKSLVITGTNGQVFVWGIDKLTNLLQSIPNTNLSANGQSCRPRSAYLPPPTPNNATATSLADQYFATLHKNETQVADLNATSTSVMLTATSITFTPSTTFTPSPTIPTLTPTAILPIIYQTATALAMTRQNEVPSSATTPTPNPTDEVAMTLTRISVEQTATAMEFLFSDNRTITLTPSYTATATPLPPTATPTSNLATQTAQAATDEAYRAATQTSSLLTATVATYTPTMTPT